MISKAAVEWILPSSYHPTSPPAVIHCSPIESNARAWSVSMLWAFPQPDSADWDGSPHLPSQLLRDSLSSVLSDYPLLCASLHQDRQGAVSVHLDNANPVALTFACCEQPLADWTPSAAQRYSRQPAAAAAQDGALWQHPHVLDYSRIPADAVDEVSAGSFAGTSCRLQVTRLACGGVVIALSAHHCLMDAVSTATLMTDWGRRCAAMRSGAQHDSDGLRVLRRPVFDRSFQLDAMAAATPTTHCIFAIVSDAEVDAISKQTAAYSPPPVVARVYHFPAAEVSAIRAAAASSDPTAARVSAYDALFAHLCQVVCSATGSTSTEAALLCQAFNGRRQLQQPDFFGSCAFWLHQRTRYADILSSLPDTAAAIHHCHASVSPAVLHAYNAFLASAPHYRNSLLTARITTHDLHCASWRNSGLYDVDFGYGRPSFTGPASSRYARYILMLDAAPDGGGGGIDICLALEPEHWKRMVEEGLLHRYAQ